jgi:hypothetical protein
VDRELEIIDRTTMARLGFGRALSTSDSELQRPTEVIRDGALASADRSREDRKYDLGRKSAYLTRNLVNSLQAVAPFPPPSPPPCKFSAAARFLKMYEYAM